MTIPWIKYLQESDIITEELWYPALSLEREGFELPLFIGVLLSVRNGSMEGAEYHMTTCPTCGNTIPLNKGFVYKQQTFCDSECCEASLESVPFVSLGEKETNEERVAVG